MGTTTARIDRAGTDSTSGDRTKDECASGDRMENEREDRGQLRHRASEDPVAGRPDDGGAR